MRQALDLFAGLGGFSLACRANGVRTACQVEIDPFLLAGLKRAWPESRHHDDIKTFDAKPYRGIWAVMGGPPCQPASRAGQQRGAEDERWLWGEALRVVMEARPAWCLFENPPGILDVGLDGIISELEGLGYEVQAVSIPACAVDSPQDRERIWILGHRESSNGRLLLQPGRPRLSDSKSTGATQDLALAGCPPGGQPMRGGSPRGNGQRLLSHESGAVADSQLPERWPNIERRGCPEQRQHGQGQAPSGPAEPAEGDNAADPWQDYQWLACPDPRHGTVIRRAPVGLHSLANGLPSRLPRGVGAKLIGALGNAIVWIVAAQIIAAMIQAERQ